MFYKVFGSQSVTQNIKKSKKTPQSTLKKRFQITTKLRQEATSYQQIWTRIKVRDPPGRENMRQRSARKAAQKYA